MIQHDQLDFLLGSIKITQTHSTLARTMRDDSVSGILYLFESEKLLSREARVSYWQASQKLIGFASNLSSHSYVVFA